MLFRSMRLGKNKGITQTGKGAKTTNGTRQSVPSNGNDFGLNEKEKGTIKDPNAQKWPVYREKDNGPKSSSCQHGFVPHHT